MGYYKFNPRRRVDKHSRHVPTKSLVRRQVYDMRQRRYVFTTQVNVVNNVGFFSLLGDIAQGDTINQRDGRKVYLSSFSSHVTLENPLVGVVNVRVLIGVSKGRLLTIADMPPNINSICNYENYRVIYDKYYRLTGVGSPDKAGMILNIRKKLKQLQTYQGGALGTGTEGTPFIWVVTDNAGNIAYDLDSTVFFKCT